VRRSCILVGLVDVVDCDDSQVAVVAEIAQGNASTGLDAVLFYRLFREIEGNGNTEEVPVCESQLVDNTVVRQLCAED
jgi:hypothetical protein